MKDEQKTENRSNSQAVILLTEDPSCKVIIDTALTLYPDPSQCTALYVEAPGFDQLPAESHQHLKDNTQYCQEKNIRIEILQGPSLSEILIEFCKMTGIRQVFLGRSMLARYPIPGIPSLERKLLNRLPTLNLHLIDDRKPSASAKKKPLPLNWHAFFPDLFKTVLLQVIATVICFLLDRLGVDEGALAPVYLLAVLVTALNTENYIWSLISAFLSVIMFDYLFAMPRFSLGYYNHDLSLVFAVTFIISLIAGFMASQLHRQSVQSQASSWRTRILLDTNHLLQDITDPKEVVPTMCGRITLITQKNVVFFPMVNGILSEEWRFFPVEPAMDNKLEIMKEYPAASYAAIHQECAGYSTAVFDHARCLYFPMGTQKKTYGVIGIELEDSILENIESSIIRAILSESALALENKLKEQEMQEIRLQSESEKLRSNILKAISHDLRTPLTSILGNATSLLERYADQPDSDERQMWKEVYDNSFLLSSMVENLLTACRLDRGAMPMNPTPELLQDLVEAGLSCLGNAGSNITTIWEDDYALVSADGHLIAQVVANIVQNALYYAPSDSNIRIRTSVEGEMACIEVQDEGPGISDEMKPKVFDLFYTGTSIPDGSKSLGLGLYLCKTIVDGHHGTIQVRDNHPSGCIFSFTLPLWTQN